MRNNTNTDCAHCRCCRTPREVEVVQRAVSGFLTTDQLNTIKATTSFNAGEMCFDCLVHAMASAV